MRVALRDDLCNSVSVFDCDLVERRWEGGGATTQLFILPTEKKKIAGSIAIMFVCNVKALNI